MTTVNKGGPKLPPKVEGSTPAQATQATTTSTPTNIQTPRADNFGGTGAVSKDLPSAPVPAGQRLSPVFARGAPTSPNEAVVQKTMDLIASGGVTSRKQLVHQHPYVDRNNVQFLIDGKEVFPRLLEDVASAKKAINISFYIFNDDKLGNELASLLIEKAKAGVEVNLSVDGIGSVQVLGSPMRKIIDRMEAGGVNIIRNHVFDLTRSNTLLNHPDHRKIVTIDGTIAYTGGMNIGDHYRDGYHDVMIRVQGAVVQQMQAEWALSFSYNGGKLDAHAPADEKTGRMDVRALRERLFPKDAEKPAGNMRARVIQAIPGESKEIFDETLRLMREATTAIRIQNPYCTNPEIQQELIAAAKRGVEVEVILPGESDHGFSHLAARAAYPKMIEAGVKIYEYPGFNHDKVMTIDDAVVSVGSSNFDDVALRHIYEMNLIVDDKELALDIKTRLFDVDRPKCALMKAEEISTLQRLTGSFWNLFHDVI